MDFALLVTRFARVRDYMSATKAMTTRDPITTDQQPSSCPNTKARLLAEGNARLSPLVPFGAAACVAFVARDAGSRGVGHAHR